MLRLALKMLFGDHAKYLMLISGITFATLLMTQGAALFCGIMSWTYSPLRNMRAHVWVTDPKVEQVNDSKPLRDTDILRVRSVEGVAWAASLYLGNNQARLVDGNFKFVTLVGLDSTTLAGAPAEVVQGQLEDLRLANTVIIDEFGIERLSEGRERPIGVGDSFEINDQEARIVGVCKAVRPFTGGPFIFTTYDRVATYVPGHRNLLSYVLVEPGLSIAPADLARRIEQETGLRAYTREEFMWSTIWWYVRNTGIPINVGLSVLIGFVVGVGVSGQTFYSFVLENTRNLAALKSMGATNWTLCRMLILQSIAVGLIGYGIGLGLVAMLGHAVLRTGKVPFLLPWHVPVATLLAVMLISALAAVLGIWRVARLEPAIVFR
jgi:putative ABC transport system permease protein